jgi:hypothetical protein
MAVRDNSWTGRGLDGYIGNSDNWSAGAFAAHDNLIFPDDADTAYTLYGDISGIALSSVVNLSALAFGGAMNDYTESTHTFVDADVSVANDTVTEADHGLQTGQEIVLTTTGTLPTGLSADTTYYVIYVSSSTYQFATTYANAIAGTDIDITAASGGGTHTATYRSAVPTHFNVGSTDGDATNIFDDRGTGARYFNVGDATTVYLYGSGTCELNGIDNGTLYVRTTGTLTVGPDADTPCEFNTVALIGGTGTISLVNVTTQAAAAIPITLIEDTPTLYTYSRLTTVSQKGGTWRHFDNGSSTHQDGTVTSIVQESGATCFYNSSGLLSGCDIRGKIDFSTENLKAKTVGVASTTYPRLYKGCTMLDPAGIVTWAEEPELIGCAMNEITANFGSNKKYTISDI